MSSLCRSGEYTVFVDNGIELSLIFCNYCKSRRSNLVTDMKISVVIPTYNRGKAILETVEHLFLSNLDGVESLEITIIDDGSKESIESLLKSCSTPPPKIRLQCIRQKNSGVGAARNRGFREAQGDIILFIDDDILVSPELIRQHVEAHREHPGSVICGFYPFISSDAPSLARFADEISGYVFNEGLQKEFVAGEIVISGQLSIEKQMFKDDEYFYGEDLTTPAAEEVELSYRLHQLKIPILHAKHIVAIHNHHLTFSWLCNQQYKYGVGLGEAFVKYPDVIELARVTGVLNRFGKPKLSDMPTVFLKKTVKNLLVLEQLRKLLLQTAEKLEKTVPNSTRLSKIYALTTSTHYWAGLKRGLQQFSNNAVEKAT